MKKELNMKFKERFPKLEITFTKLRSIKRELQRIAINGQAHDIFSRIFQIRIYEFFLPNILCNICSDLLKTEKNWWKKLVDQIGENI